ncbi:MAG: Asp-tRNA(Asn)/Glu-tRNA(Gln) amidotransferase subunit GatB [Pseudomonadota bacterium]
MSFETIIGLEVHAQLKTKTKMFCRCENLFGREPNTLTCPVCLGLPGALPVVNSMAIRFAVWAANSLNCTINRHSVFARKNYFYPDLPKGYQISQFDQPLAVNGRIEIKGDDGSRTIKIIRVHLEEDAGKLLHGDNLQTKEGSLVDLNRCGVPLIEIVGAPDLRSPAEASDYLKELRQVLKYIEVCDGNMEEGSLRCDANVSLRPVGVKEFGTKVEIKNLNSFKHVRKALEYEVDRQTKALQAGKKIHQETRLWNPDQGITTSMRSKEETHDYRYFPEPDLLPLNVPEKWLHERGRPLEQSLTDAVTVSASIDARTAGRVELPNERRARFEKDFALPSYDADVLTAEKEVADYFEATLTAYAPGNPEKAKTVSNYVMGEILRLVKERTESIEQLKIRPENLSALLKMIDAGTISGKIAKDVLDEMAESGKAAQEIVKVKGLTQISDTDSIRKTIQKVLATNTDQLAQYRAGKEKMFGFFVGQVMKATQGKANPAVLNQLLKEELSRGV